jgi:hypothetical protein
MISLRPLHRVISIIAIAYAVPVSLIVNTKLHTPEARGISSLQESRTCLRNANMSGYARVAR